MYQTAFVISASVARAVSEFASSAIAILYSVNLRYDFIRDFLYYIFGILYIYLLFTGIDNLYYV